MSRTATRAARRWALAAAAAVLLAGCGGGGDVSVAQAPGAAPPVSASGPSPAPEVGADQDPLQVLGGEVIVAPTVTTAPETDGRVYADEPQCPDPPPGVELDEAGTPGLQDAVEEIVRKYESMEPGETGPNYTGVVVCEPGNFFTMFRVPGGASFDASIRKVAADHDVTVHLRDTKYSLATLERTRAEVNARRAALERGGARVAHTVPQFHEGAYLEVGITGKKAAARRILADLGDRIRVVTGSVHVPLAKTVSPDEVRQLEAAPAADAGPPPAPAAPEPATQGLDVTKLLPPR